MRFLGVFGLVVVVTLGVTFFVDGPGDEGSLETVVVPTPVPTATAEPTPTPTPAPTATPEPTPTPTPTTLRLVFTGEILSHGPIIRQAAAYGTDGAHDYVPMFEQVTPLLETADLAVCHLETPVSRDNTDLAGYPIFNAPAELPAGLRDAGYDACSTASNHSFDKGAAGVISTLDQMEAAGLPQAGMARSAEEKATPTLYEVGELTVGHLSYSYSLNGFVLPADQPYLVNVTTVEEVLAEAAAARAAGAELVVLSIQWGNEYQVNPSQTQIDQATAFLESPDIDIIVGAHVHVVQPVDMINGKYVFYGIGNFLSNQSANCCPAATQNGIMAFVDVTGSDAGGWAVSDVAVVPTRVDRTDYTIVPLTTALASGDLDGATRDLYQTVVDETTEVVRRRGVNVPIIDPLADPDR